MNCVFCNAMYVCMYVCMYICMFVCTMVHTDMAYSPSVFAGFPAFGKQIVFEYYAMYGIPVLSMLILR